MQLTTGRDSVVSIEGKALFSTVFRQSQSNGVFRLKCENSRGTDGYRNNTLRSEWSHKKLHLNKYEQLGFDNAIA